MLRKTYPSGGLPQGEAAVVPLAYDTVGAAKALGIGRSTVFEEIAAGRLDARKVGRRTVISREACLAWLAALPSNREARAA